MKNLDSGVTGDQRWCSWWLAVGGWRDEDPSGSKTKKTVQAEGGVNGCLMRWLQNCRWDVAE